VKVRPTLAAAAVLLALGILAGAVVRADVKVTKRDAQMLQQKVATISAHADKLVKQAAAKPPSPAQAQVLRTTVTENEVNAYLVYDSKEQLPTGVVDPAVSILGGGRLAGRAVVDLDAVRREKKPTSLLDPMNYLSGRLPVAATGTLTTKEGVGRFQLESASVSGVPIPKMLLQEIVSYYTRTPESPGGINIDDPFALPVRIREIQVERGQAIIVQ
jgi:hypothetical protein